LKIDFEQTDIEALAQKVAALLAPVLSGARIVEQDEVFDVPGLATYLKVDASWIYKSLDRLPHVKVGRYLRFKKSAVDKWMDRETIRPIEVLKVVNRR
jgi:excisionase family DNA binding protein